jgi:hypothetical protein
LRRVAFLLFLAGLEIDIRGLRGRPVRLAALGFATLRQAQGRLSPDVGRGYE